MSITIEQAKVAELVETDCGHVVDEDDVNQCADGIAGVETYCAGKCYEAHAAACPACNRQDAADYDYDAA